MIYYPPSTPLLAGIREVLIIGSSQDTPRSEPLLGEGSSGSMKLQYAVQPSHHGLVQGSEIGERFLDGALSVLITDDIISDGCDLYT